MEPSDQSVLGEDWFCECVSEQGVYTKCWKDQDREEKIIVCLYVDDMLLTGSKPEAIVEFKSQMHSEFEMSDLGRLNYFLGIEF